MVGIGVNVQLFEHFPPQAILRQHAPYGEQERQFRLFLYLLGEGHASQSARIPGVPVVGQLVRFGRPGQTYGFGVDNHYVVTGVQMRRKDGFVLTPENRGHFGRRPTHNNAVKINQPPLAAARVDFRYISLHCLPQTHGSYIQIKQTIKIHF